MKGNSKRPKIVVIAVFWLSSGWTGILMVRSYQVNFGKGGSAGKVVGLVLCVCVWDCIPVRDGASVKGSVVSTGPPTAVLRHEMEGGRTWALGASDSAVPQHGVELGLGDGQEVWYQAAWAAGYRWSGCCADVMRCVVLDLAVAPCWLGQPREFFQEAA